MTTLQGLLAVLLEQAVRNQPWKRHDSNWFNGRLIVFRMAWEDVVTCKYCQQFRLTHDFYVLKLEPRRNVVRLGQARANTLLRPYHRKTSKKAAWMFVLRIGLVCVNRRTFCAFVISTNRAAFQPFILFSVAQHRKDPGIKHRAGMKGTFHLRMRAYLLNKHLQRRNYASLDGTHQADTFVLYSLAFLLFALLCSLRMNSCIVMPSSSLPVWTLAWSTFSVWPWDVLSFLSLACPFLSPQLLSVNTSHPQSGIHLFYVFAEHYFAMSKRDAQDAFFVYQSFLTQCSELDRLIGNCRVRTTGNDECAMSFEKWW